ncbi:hypothetical protein PRIPAC_71694 [Pristionchus pacificus]|uniref:Uncharacterized protein n=1 Tax=Pristionchus pacificus TaxID=54126 RepID=A0A2A6C709_PRIPA|nr:hypothetical protein PRIPAC_71694 [Pristionchus pacificus]|eukprot:PDM73975.1 hypothetical protein PRIPAC_41331 [Pristionchus pacificus]
MMVMHRVKELFHYRRSLFHYRRSMNLLLLHLVLLSAAFSVAAKEHLPNKYYGRYILDHSVIVQGKAGNDWFSNMYKKKTTFEKVFAKTAKNNTFDFATLYHDRIKGEMKGITYSRITLGRTFRDEGLGGSRHKITFFLKNGKIYEKHRSLTDPKEVIEEYEYFFDGSFLVKKVKINGAVYKQFYRRECWLNGPKCSPGLSCRERVFKNMAAEWRSRRVCAPKHLKRSTEDVDDYSDSSASYED